ncbi:LytR/AlgR family response regulator transcription factor [Ekhidna lutea]|nr:LytTR family DNA-binding domain-containing protein [Ekhidna lutea]
MIHTYLIIRGISCDWECMDFIEYLELWLACGLMIGFCYLTFSLYARYLYFHSMIGQKELASGSIELIGEGKDSLILPMSEIISLKADDNYVDIQMIKEKKTLRSSLSAIENQLEPFSQFIRVHRSYMINFHYVEDYPRKDTILLRQRDERIELPVSKKYQEQVNELFTHPK